jgi:hypothetical protein
VLQIRTRGSDGRVLISRGRISPEELLVKEAALAATDESACPVAPASNCDGDSGWMSDASDSSFDDFDRSLYGQATAQTVLGTRSTPPPVAWDMTTATSIQRGRLSQPGAGVVDPDECWDHTGLPLSNPPSDALPFNLQQAGHAVLGDGPDGRQWLADGEEVEGRLEQSALNMFMFGVQGTLVRQAASVVDPTARIRLVSHIKVSAARVLCIFACTACFEHWHAGTCS